MTKYDDASWHYGGAYPEDLPDEAAATHIGMFVAWCLLNGFAGGEVEGELTELQEREVTPGAFLMQVLDEKFVSDDLTDDGNAFAVAYYVGKDNDSRYVDDYLAAFQTSTTDIYRVPDTWEVFDRVADRISARHNAWIAVGRPRYIV